MYMAEHVGGNKVHRTCMAGQLGGGGMFTVLFERRLMDEVF